jgi:hypothetical protein
MAMVRCRMLREDRENRGRRAPMFGLLPLRITRALRAHTER